MKFHKRIAIVIDENGDEEALLQHRILLLWSTFSVASSVTYARTWLRDSYAEHLLKRRKPVRYEYADRPTKEVR